MLIFQIENSDTKNFEKSLSSTILQFVPNVPPR